MTITLQPPSLAPRGQHAVRHTGPGTTFGRWLRRHWKGLAIVAGLLTIVGAVNFWNLQGWPLYLDDDEGTYVVQAWAVVHLHQLAPYTYWYDHPPFGWIQMGAYIWATGGFTRYPLAVMAGREFMWVINLVACGLLYVLARRLGLSRWAGVVAVVLFGLSPLGVYFHRMVWLDNIGTVWMLAALVVAASPKRSIGAAIGSAALMAGAFWSKETLALAVPVMLWLLWRHSTTKPHRSFWYGLTVFSLAGILGYLGFAALRNELFEGPGHVSLIWAIKWQLFARASSGSVLSTHSQTYGLAMLWYHLDPWIIIAGLAAAGVAVFIRRLRPFVLAVAIQVLMLVHGGYTPYAFIVAALPFLAVLVAGVLDAWWKAGGRRVRKYLGRSAVIATLAAFAVVVAPAWGRAYVDQSHSRAPVATAAAERWVEQHVPAGSTVVVNDYMWQDLRVHSRVKPIWVWKVDLDPYVMKHELPNGWRSIDYIVWTPGPTGLSQGELPTLSAALAHGHTVANLGGGITIVKVGG